jgi:hypothetical protein
MRFSHALLPYVETGGVCTGFLKGSAAHSKLLCMTGDEAAALAWLLLLRCCWCCCCAHLASVLPPLLCLSPAQTSKQQQQQQPVSIQSPLQVRYRSLLKCTTEHA